MLKKIFKGVWKTLVWVVNFVGMVTIYMLFMSTMWGKGEIKYQIPFTDEAKTIQWDNSSGNK